MKKILFLLLFTIASYGQAVFDEGIQITGNANSATATKVNVQEANGKVNTQTIKTGFNKNIGLNSGDVVGATTLLNQYSTTPIDWTATTFNSGQVVFYGGKQWIAKTATVAGDVPAVSSKWEEITFEALANKTTTVDQTIIDGSTNAVSGNAVFDGLVLKAPLASPSLTGTPTAPTATAGANTTQVATTAFVTNGIATADSENVKLTGNQTISGQKSFSLTGKIDMQTNNAFPAISVTSLGSNCQSAAEFINNSSSPYSTALRLRTSSSGGVGNLTLSVSNQSPIGTGIVSNASNGGVSISSQSGNGDSYISNITEGGTGRNYVGRNDGTETYSVDKIGNVIGSSYIKRSAPTTNLLLAGGGDIAQSNFQPAITGLTTNYLPKWNGSGFGNSIASEVGGEFKVNGSGLFTSGIKMNYGSTIDAIGFTNTKILSIGYQSGTNDYVAFFTPGSGGGGEVMRYLTNQTLLIGSNLENGSGSKLQVAGTISASPATTANQVPTWGQVQAIARPYKVYTALLSQTGTNAPTVVIGENTLGGAVTWSRNASGEYYADSSNLYTNGKTYVFITNGDLRFDQNGRVGGYLIDASRVVFRSLVGGTGTDGVYIVASIEIRVYN